MSRHPRDAKEVSVNIQSLYGSRKKRVFLRVAVSRAVHSQECPLGKLLLYRNYSKSLKVLNKGDLYGRRTKLLLYRNYSNSLKVLNKGGLYGRRTPRDCDQVQKEKGNYVFLHLYTSSLKLRALS